MTGLPEYSRVYKALLAVLLLVLLWAPMPLGSNRPWSLALLETAVFLLLAATLLRFSLSSEAFRLKHVEILLYNALNL